MSNTDIYYLTLPTDSADEATSLAAYLARHGYSAVAELNEVTCPITVEPAATTADLHQLRGNWLKWWANSDSELFGLPVFVKSDNHCTEAHS